MSERLLFITKLYFTKEYLTVLTSPLKISRVGTISNLSSIKTDILKPFCLQNFTKYCVTLANINGAEHRPKGRRLRTTYLVFWNTHAKPKNFWYWCGSALAWYQVWIEKLHFLNILPLFSSHQILFYPYTYAYQHIVSPKLFKVYHNYF